MPPPAIQTGVCIVGGGPAGIMTGLLFARAGIATVVLEKHEDFFRDFRGDTIHPSTLQLLDELGVLDELLPQLTDRVTVLGARIAATHVTIADFSHIPARCKFLAFMPQWDFLNFLAGQARQYPSFRLMTQTACTGLIEEDGRIAGVVATSPDGEVQIRARLVVGADGRGSTVRQRAGLEVRDLGAPFDVLWMRIHKQPGDVNETAGILDRGRFFVMIDRHEYFQCGFVIAKGSLSDVRERGLGWLREQIASIEPALRSRLADDLDSWDKAKLLEVKVDRLNRWYRDGLLCIGDAAHAMSPIGGVGINLAIQDAVATANALSVALQNGTPSPRDLAAVQHRREFPTKVTQGLQVFIQNRILRPIVEGTMHAEHVPLPVRLLNAIPPLRTLPGIAVGLGVRPEHVRSPKAATAAR